MHGIGERGAHDRDRGSCSLRGHGRTAGGRQDHTGTKLDQLLCKHGQPLDVTIGKSGRELEIVPVGVTEVAHTVQKGLDESPGRCSLAQ